MDKLPVTEDEIKDILRYREKRIASIQDKMYAINKDMRNTDYIIEMVSLRSSEISDMPKGSGRHTDLGDTYIDYRKALNRRAEEYKKLLRKLIQEEECIERVWQCYLLLGEPYYTILTELYVKNQKYAAVEHESGYSRQVFEKHRKTGVSLIMKFYSSQYSAWELAEYSIKANQKRKSIKNKQVFRNENYQISMEDMLESFQ